MANNFENLNYGKYEYNMNQNLVNIGHGIYELKKILN